MCNKMQRRSLRQNTRERAGFRSRHRSHRTSRTSLGPHTTVPNTAGLSPWLVLGTSIPPTQSGRSRAKSAYHVPSDPPKCECGEARVLICLKCVCVCGVGVDSVLGLTPRTVASMRGRHTREHLGSFSRGVGLAPRGETNIPAHSSHAHECAGMLGFFRLQAVREKSFPKVCTMSRSCRASTRAMDDNLCASRRNSSGTQACLHALRTASQALLARDMTASPSPNMYGECRSAGTTVLV